MSTELVGMPDYGGEKSCTPVLYTPPLFAPGVYISTRPHARHGRVSVDLCIYAHLIDI